MAELKEAPRPKAENGSGQSNEIATGTMAAPMKSTGNAYAYMRRFTAIANAVMAAFIGPFRCPRAPRLRRQPRNSTMAFSKS